MKQDIRPFRKLGKAYVAKTETLTLYIKRLGYKFVLLKKAEVGYVTLGEFTTLTAAIVAGSEILVPQEKETT